VLVHLSPCAQFSFISVPTVREISRGVRSSSELGLSHCDALAARGVRAIRLIQGVLGLTRRHPRERVLAAVSEARTHQHFRYQTIRQRVERTPVRPTQVLATDDPAIRPMTQYTLEDFLE
jgi:hypothetical protein